MISRNTFHEFILTKRTLVLAIIVSPLAAIIVFNYLVPVFSGQSDVLLFLLNANLGMLFTTLIVLWQYIALVSFLKEANKNSKILTINSAFTVGYMVLLSVLLLSTTSYGIYITDGNPEARHTGPVHNMWLLRLFTLLFVHMVATFIIQYLTINNTYKGIRNTELRERMRKRYILIYHITFWLPVAAFIISIILFMMKDLSRLAHH